MAKILKICLHLFPPLEGKTVPAKAKLMMDIIKFCPLWF